MPEAAELATNALANLAGKPVEEIDIEIAVAADDLYATLRETCSHGTARHLAAGFVAIVHDAYRRQQAPIAA